jgi:UDP-glucose 4-epimerase
MAGLKWLITGGCGFIGANVVRLLLKEGGHAVRIIDNLSTGARETLLEVVSLTQTALRNAGTEWREGVELTVGDIADASLADEAVLGADIVLHLAANTGVQQSIADPIADCKANVIGTLNYLEAARKQGVRRVLTASSAAVGGQGSTDWPSSPYGAGKLAGEAYCSVYRKAFGLLAIPLRFGNVYGPYSDKKSSVVAKFIGQILNGEPIAVHGDGLQRRKFIHASDVARAIRLAAALNDAPERVLAIAGPAAVNVNDLVEVLRRHFAARGILVAVRTTPARLGDCRDSTPDTTDAMAAMDWRPETDLEAGLDDTIAWFVNRRRTRPS